MKRKSNLKHLKVWSCLAYLKNIFEHKLSARSDKCRFVGYLKKIKGYYFYHSTEQKMFVSRYATFWKKKLSKKELVGEMLNLEKFKIYIPFQKYLWLDHKVILNQKYLRIRYIHNIHLLSEGQIECVKHL